MTITAYKRHCLHTVAMPWLEKSAKQFHIGQLSAQPPAPPDHTRPKLKVPDYVPEIILLDVLLLGEAGDGPHLDFHPRVELFPSHVPHSLIGHRSCFRLQKNTSVTRQGVLGLLGDTTSCTEHTKKGVPVLGSYRVSPND